MTSEDLAFVCQTLDLLKSEPEKKRHQVATTLKSRGSLAFLAPFIERNLNPAPIRSLFNIAFVRRNATCCLRECPYIDLEYWDSFAHTYSRCFKTYERNCTRLHFFKGPPGKEGLLREGLLSGKANTELRNDATIIEFGEDAFTYLGYAVLRPTASNNLGRTAISFDSRYGKDKAIPPPETDPEYKGFPCIKGASLAEANLLCAQLKAHSIPFVQQDVVSGMCATASCWTASQILAEHHDLHKYPYLEITRRIVSRSTLTTPGDLPLGRGLTPHEIVEALCLTGARAQLFQPIFPNDLNASRNRSRLRELLYTFIESHLPVIVLLSSRSQATFHAACAIGHLLSSWSIDDFRREMAHMSSENVQKAGFERRSVYKHTEDHHYLISEAMQQFYIHNDAYGPYDRLSFYPFQDSVVRASEAQKQDGRKYPACPVYLEKNPENERHLVGLVVPFPPYVKNSPEAITVETLKFFDSYFRNKTFQSSQHNILWRTLLLKGSLFKRSLLGRGYPDEAIGFYSRLHFPKYVWLYEFTLFVEADVPEILSSNMETLRPIHGEFLYDTSTPPGDVNLIALRFGKTCIPGYLDIRDIVQSIQDSLKDLDEHLLVDCYTDSHVNQATQ